MGIYIKTNLLVFFFLCASTILAAEVKSPLEVVNTRMEAHNRHDLDAFLKTYSDQVRIYTYPDKQLGKPGKAHLAGIFGPLFTEKSVKTKIHHQIENGNYVVNHETVTRQGKTVVYVSIYEVENGLIQSVRFIHQN